MAFRIRGSHGELALGRWHAAQRGRHGADSRARRRRIHADPRLAIAAHRDLLSGAMAGAARDHARFDLEPLIDDQENDTRLSTGAIYWEGAVRAYEPHRSGPRLFGAHRIRREAALALRCPCATMTTHRAARPPLRYSLRAGQDRPVIAKNRFFQVPHCNGMGHAKPRSHAAMRGVKAEGGWAVVSTEEVEIHPSSDLSPYVEGRLWDDSDIPCLALMTDAVHRHGALAAIELVHAGMNAPNLYSREISLRPEPRCEPGKLLARAGPRHDEVRHPRISPLAPRRRRCARAAPGSTSSMCMPPMACRCRCISCRRATITEPTNTAAASRTASRLLRELIEDTKEAVGAECAVAVRFAVDELRGADGIDGGRRRAARSSPCWPNCRTCGT